MSETNRPFPSQLNQSLDTVEAQFSESERERIDALRQEFLTARGALVSNDSYKAYVAEYQDDLKTASLEEKRRLGYDQGLIESAEEFLMQNTTMTPEEKLRELFLSYFELYQIVGEKDFGPLAEKAKSALYILGTEGLKIPNFY